MKNRLAVAILLTFLSSGLFFSFNFILAKVLGADKYGEIQYYLSFIQLISLSFSLNYASLYMGSKILKKDSKTLSLFLTTQSFLLLIVIIPLVFILTSYINSKITISFLIATSYLFVMMTTFSLEYNSDKKVVSSILTGSLISRLLLISFFSLFISLGYSYSQYYIYAYFISIVIVVCFSFYKLKPKLHFKLLPFSRAWKFYVLGVTGTSFTYIAQILQKEFYGFSQLAVLSLSILLLTGLGIWGSLLIKIILPHAHDLWERKDIAGISNIYGNNTYLELITILPVVILLLFNIKNISDILGSNYNNLEFTFYILSIGYLFSLITGITGTLLRVTENEHFELLNELVRLFSGLTFIYLLRQNTYGVAIAISASMTIYNLLKFIEIFHIFKLTPLTIKYSIDILKLLAITFVLLFGVSKIGNTFLFVLATIMSLVISYSYTYKLITNNVQLIKLLRI